jgi:hypothetical protein
MRDQTFFTIVIGCFVAGMVLAFSFMITHGVGHQQPGTVAFSFK